MDVYVTIVEMIIDPTLSQHDYTFRVSYISIVYHRSSPLFLILLRLIIYTCYVVFPIDHRSLIFHFCFTITNLNIFLFICD